jgi:hypothetical protein
VGAPAPRPARPPARELGPTRSGCPSARTYRAPLLLRPLARIVLGVTAVLVGVVGVRQLDRASPRWAAEVVEGAEAAGGTRVRCSDSCVRLDASVATLSGDTPSVTGPYELLQRLQELGGACTAGRPGLSGRAVEPAEVATPGPS